MKFLENHVLENAATLKIGDKNDFNRFFTAYAFAAACKL